MEVSKKLRKFPKKVTKRPKKSNEAQNGWPARRLKTDAKKKERRKELRRSVKSCAGDLRNSFFALQGRFVTFFSRLRNFSGGLRNFFCSFVTFSRAAFRCKFLHTRGLRNFFHGLRNFFGQLRNFFGCLRNFLGWPS